MSRTEPIDNIPAAHGEEQPTPVATSMRPHSPGTPPAHTFRWRRPHACARTGEVNGQPATPAPAPQPVETPVAANVERCVPEHRWCGCGRYIRTEGDPLCMCEITRTEYFWVWLEGDCTLVDILSIWHDPYPTPAKLIRAVNDYRASIGEDLTTFKSAVLAALPIQSLSRHMVIKWEAGPKKTVGFWLHLDHGNKRRFLTYYTNHIDPSVRTAQRLLPVDPTPPTSASVCDSDTGRAYDLDWVVDAL